MTTLSTAYEWANRLMNEFNEMRIGATDVIKLKSVELAEFVTTFVSNHSSELLYGSLTVVTVYTLLSLWVKLIGARWDVEVLEDKVRWYKFDAELYKECCDNYDEQVAELDAQITTLNYAIEQANETNRDMSLRISDLEEERDELESDRDEHQGNSEYWEERYEEVRDERDEYQSNVSYLEDRVSTLESMAATYKELVDTLESPQLKLAA